LIDSGRYLAAGYAARAVNGLLAACVVGAVAWAVSQAFPRRPQLWLAAALVAALNPWVVLVGGAVYNDVLGALVATILFGLTIRSLHQGTTVRRDVLLTLAVAAAMATRASLVVVVVGCLAVLVIHRGLTTKSWSRALGAICRYTIVGLAALIPSAWFYLRNLRLTGRLLGGDPAWAQENIHRTTRSTIDVVTDPQSWKALMAVFSYGVVNRDLMMGLLLGIPLVLGLVAFVLARRSTTRWTPRAMLARRATFSLLAGTALAIVAMQFQYAAGGGGLIPRYLLPLILVISLAVGYGLSELPGVGLRFLAPWAGLAVVQLVLRVARGVGAASGPGTAPIYATAAWAAVGLCIAAVAVALGYQDAVRRAFDRRSGLSRMRPVAATTSVRPARRP